MANDHKAVQAVHGRIGRAARRVGRNAEDITLVAVSKTKPIGEIIAAYEAGVRHFGENRTGEFEEKVRALGHRDGLKWHFIGHLQTGQSRVVAQFADFFHAVDRVKIARRLSLQLGELGRNLSVFIQVNVSGEKSKAGFACDDWENDTRQREALFDAIGEIATFPNLRIPGLMTMAPFDASEETLRRIFRSMANLSIHVRETFPQLAMGQLSMGMSGDFEIAIEEGATLVRIGSAIFGKRRGALCKSLECARQQGKNGRKSGVYTS